ncbi:hypothetical protein GIB67_017116 [Kingdonia uniflora]|uniref:Uncharacterized protein n=1 Tax=Kingdonia uniflora TaxID=39325 RepID=A0A7J7NCW0_9MAGN|nr:hypothetical protein GIB67_017116 [Kingdonia uniflora]
MHISREVEIKKLDIEQAENLYRRCLGSTDFFPDDIDRILKNKLSLGTWVAYPRGESWDSEFESNGRFPTSWAILSVWNTGDLFKLRVGKVLYPVSYIQKFSDYSTESSHG